VGAGFECPVQLWSEIEGVESSLHAFDKSAHAFQFIRPLWGMTHRSIRNLNRKGNLPDAWQVVFVDRKILAQMDDFFELGAVLASARDALLGRK